MNYNTNSGFADDPAYAGASEYRELVFPVTRQQFDAEFGTPATGGTRKLKRGLVRWAEYEEEDGTLFARWVSVSKDSDVGYGFLL